MRIAAVSSLSVRVEEIGPQEILPYAELSRAHYGDAPIADPAHLRWKFLENPQGVSMGVHLFDNDRLVGRVVAQPRRFVSPDGRERTAAYMVDLLVHPDFRSISALTKLMTGMSAIRERFDFVVVTPNANGIPVWRGLLKMEQPFEMGVSVAALHLGRLPAVPPWIRPLARTLDRPLLYLSRGVGGAFARMVTLEEEWPARGELDALLASPPVTIRGRRDIEFLQWRFKDSPVFKYRVRFVRTRGRLVGYIATRRAMYAGYDCAFVVDAFGSSDCTARDWAAVRWRVVQAEARSDGADMMMVLGNQSCGALRHLAGFPFVRVPVGLLPQRTPAFVNYWREKPATVDARSMELTLADCDMI